MKGRADILYPKDVHNKICQFIRFIRQLLRFIGPFRVIRKQVRVFPEHRCAGTGRTDNIFGILKRFDHPFHCFFGVMYIAAVVSRLPAANLPFRKINLFQTNVGKATVELLERLGGEGDFPEGQICCGQPGCKPAARSKSALPENQPRTQAAPAAQPLLFRHLFETYQQDK